MRLIIKIVLVFLAVFVVAAVLAPHVIPVDTIRNQVVERLEAATGRTVSMDKLSLSLFPDIALDAENVKISNPDWAGGGDMVAMQKLRLGVELLPLLHKQVHVKELTLKSPVIALLRRGSAANWEFGKAAAPKAAQQAQASSRNGMQEADDLYVGRITIQDGTLTYSDMGTGAKQTVSKVNVTLSAPSPSSEATLKGSAEYNGNKAALELMLDKPLSMFTSAGAQVKLKAQYDPFAINWTGTLALGGKVPAITGAIEIPEIDTTQSDSQEKGTGGGKAAAAKSEAQHWSDAPISLAGLASAEADLAVTLDKLVLSHTTLTDIKAHVALAKGALTVKTEVIKAYGGDVQLAFAVNAINAASVSVVVSGVQAKDLLGSDRVTGTLASRVSVTTSGNSERAMVSALGGKGDFVLKDGTFKGVNLGEMVRNPTLVFNPESATTAFSVISGSYTIKNGVATNSDLKLTSSTINAGGEGQADLPRWQVNYLLKPMLTVAGGNAAPGLIVPVRVSGALDKPSYRPDLQAALKENLENPANLRGVAKQLLNGNTLKGLFR